MIQMIPQLMFSASQKKLRIQTLKSMGRHMANFIAATLVGVLVSGSTVARADDTVATPSSASATSPVTDMSSADSLKPNIDEDTWQFGLGIPLWFPQIDGNATVLGHQENVNISYNTLRQHLDSVFAIAVDARKGKFDFYGDVAYMKFSAGNTTASSGLKFLVSDAGVGYTLIKTESDHPFILEGTAGVRYWYASSWLTVTTPIAFHGTKTWNVVDPVLGLRGSQYFTPKLHLDFSADGGGFNISHDTDWTWSATGVLTYDFVKWFSLSAGYKALALDESEGSGAGKNGVNFIFHGALVVAQFNF
jgi:hypothetical protein